MYVRLRTVKQVDINGETKTFRPGDWVEVSKSQALSWMAENPPSAEIVNKTQAAQLSGKGCGAVIFGNYERRLQIVDKFPAVEVANSGAARLLFSKTLFWDTSAQLRAELVPVGFTLLERWEMAIPLASYTTLAQSIGSPEEREETKALIHDLRVPYFDSRLIYARRTKDTEQVINLWRADVDAGKDPNLSLLRAVYRVKPLVLSLPASWVTGREHVR